MTSIRAAVPDDLEALVRLDATLFGPRAWSVDAMRAELEAERGDRCLLVAEATGELLGYVAGLAGSTTADLLRIGVQPAAQRGGVGTVLLEALRAEMSHRGCRDMLLEVDAADSGAIAFYRRNGFVDIARRDRYYIDGSDALVMRRELATGERTLSISRDGLDQERDR